MTLDTKRDLIAACVYGHMVMVRGPSHPRVPRSQSYPNAWQGDKDRCLECADDILIISGAAPSYDTLKERVAALEAGLRDSVAMLLELQPGYIWGSEPYNRIEYDQKLLVARLEALLHADGGEG